MRQTEFCIARLVLDLFDVSLAKVCINTGIKTYQVIQLGEHIIP